MNILKELSKYHQEWINICKRYVDNPEDVVQDMYIKLNGRSGFEYKDTINKYFVYRVLTNMCLDELRSKKQTVNIDSVTLTNEEEYDKSLDILFQRIDDIISDWDYFERRLFEVYMFEGLSYRGIANGESKKLENIKSLPLSSVKRGSNISVSTIFGKIKEAKEAIRNELWEDYLDYKNGDYDRI